MAGVVGALEEGLICHVKGFGFLGVLVELCRQALGILLEVQSHRERGGEPTVAGRTGGGMSGPEEVR